MKGVRLSGDQIRAIRFAFKESFLNEDHLWLFGSRTDSSKRGGDIDLYVETSLDIEQVLQSKLDFARELFLRLDDQKIDIIIKHKNAKPLPIYQHAQETGVKIV
jgi:hypothetical protein